MPEVPPGSPLDSAITQMIAACSLVPYNPKACMDASTTVGRLLALANSQNAYMAEANHQKVQAGFAALAHAQRLAKTAGSGVQLASVSGSGMGVPAPSRAPAPLTPEAQTIAALAQLGTTAAGTGAGGTSLAAIACP
jgi:hypothetical protein